MVLLRVGAQKEKPKITRINPEGKALPEGTRVSVVPEQPTTVMTLKEWLKEARQLKAQLPKTSDSVEII